MIYRLEIVPVGKTSTRLLLNYLDIQINYYVTQLQVLLRYNHYFFSWYLLLKHRSFFSSATLVARLADPLFEGLIVRFSGSGFQYSSFGSTIEYLCYLLTQDLPNGFPFLWFLGFM